MRQPPPGYETVFSTSERHECMESRLVLDAAGVSSVTVHRDGQWFLCVSPDDLATAASEIDAYRRENPTPSARPAPSVPVYEGAAAAVLVYAAVVIVIGIQSAQSAWGLAWMSAGQMQAGQVMAGEWWRTVTALTLHSDFGHIAANLVFGAVFGLLAGRALGGGVAWLAIVVSGALGNFINAMVQAPNHTSIGASTAVFAALGILVSHAIRSWASAQETPLKRWSPMIGGVVLLAFTGVGGERTDVVAHLTGFLAGLLIGWLGSGFPIPWLASATVQKCAGLAALAIVMIAWIVGLIARG